MKSLLYNVKGIILLCMHRLFHQAFNIHLCVTKRFLRSAIMEDLSQKIIVSTAMPPVASLNQVSPGSPGTTRFVDFIKELSWNQIETKLKPNILMAWEIRYGDNNLFRGNFQALVYRAIE